MSLGLSVSGMYPVALTHNCSSERAPGKLV